MGRTIERIEQDLMALEQAIAATIEEFRSHYNNYLIALGQAAYQQLIMASYHLCTQGYPERFLQLSFDQRQKLQQALKQLAKQTQAQLQACHDPQAQLPAPNPIDTDHELVTTFPPEPSPTPGSSSPFAQFALEPLGTSHAEATDQTSPKLIASVMETIRWQEQVEQAIAATLQLTTRQTNLLLQRADVFPNKIPLPILEAAVRAEINNEAAGPPNILQFLIDTSTQDTGRDPHNEDEIPVVQPKLAPLQVITVHLRLTEIEFADANLMSWRTKIRQVSARLSSLAREHQKKQHERAIAEAEAAWRVSWFDD